MDIMNMLIGRKGRQEPVRCNFHFSDQLIVFQEAKERVFIGVRVCAAHLATFLWHFQRIEKNLDSIVNIPAASYQIARLISPKKEDV